MLIGTLLITLMMTSASGPSASPATSPLPADEQTDLYLWPPTLESPDITEWQEVERYRFRRLQASDTLSQRVYKALQTKFPNACYYQVPYWPIDQFDLGADGTLLRVSCRTDSYDSWTVYFQLTPQGTLNLLTFDLPKFKFTATGESAVSPEQVGTEPSPFILNGDILQRRLVLSSSMRSPQKWLTRQEWVWRQGEGFKLVRIVAIPIHNRLGSIENSIVPRR